MLSHSLVNLLPTKCTLHFIDCTNTLWEVAIAQDVFVFLLVSMILCHCLLRTVCTVCVLPYFKLIKRILILN